MTQASEILIEAEGLAAGYGARPAIEGISFRAAPGQRVAILGPNGGGKTTLLRVFAGELEAQTGSLTLGARCATVPQTDRSRLDFPVTALDVAQMGCLATLPWWRRPGRDERRLAAECLRRVGLAELADRNFGQLSGGQRQRALIARALTQQAPILLLDEPFAGLDGPASADLERLIADLAAEGHLLLIATHDLVQASRWERVLCLNRRQIAFGPPAEALDRAILERTYGDEIIDLPGGGSVLPAHHHH